MEGNYSISVPADAKTLVFTYIGYSTKEVAISSNSFNVTLVSDAKQLSEVVVTGYQNQTKATQTGAISQVKAEELENVPMSSFDKAIQGKVPGLQSVGASGQPGSAQQIRIRGIGSMTASSAPLVVVDGVPIESGDISRNTTTANALAGINPNDIESLSVLKDASASSIYGSRAANGVIVITTKSGKAGKTKLRFDAETGVASRAYYNEKTRPLTTEENLMLMDEAFLNNPYYVEAYELNKDNIRDFILDVYGTDPTVNTNWYDQIKQTGVTQQYNLSADGGNEKTQFSLSGGYFKQQGTVKTSEFDRITGRFNIKHNLNDKIAFGTSLMVASSGQVGPLNSGYFSNPVMSSLFLMPDLAPYDANGNLNTGAAFQSPFNPVAILAYDKNNNSTLKSVGNIFGEYKILPNLKFSTKFGIDYNNLEEDSYNNPMYGDGEAANGYSYRYDTRYFNYVWTNLLNYKWNVTGDNNLIANITAGYEAQKSKYRSASIASSNVPLNIDYTVPSVGAIPLTAAGTNEAYSFASILGIADVSYKGKYVLSGSFRRDGSSRFGSENRFGNFWSVGGSWNLDQEEFIKDINWITQLKLRASYGVNGNAGIGNYSWRPLYSYTASYAGEVGSAPSSIGNENLTWEKNKPLDIGADVSFFGDRLNVTAEYYSRKTTSLLMNRPLSATTGFLSRLENIGAMKNSGVEFAISGTPVVAGDFKWDVNFNISKNKNEILELVKDDQVSSPFIRKVGYDYQTYYLPLWAGVDPANGDPLWYTDDTRSQTTNNYASAKRSLTGKSAAPKAFGSAGTAVAYKGLTLDAMFYYSFGNYIYDPYFQYLNSEGYYNGSYNQRATELTRWQKPGDITNVPRMDYDGTGSYRTSDRILNSGDFIRLRDLTVGYTLPKSLISKAKLSNVKVYVRGTNIWTSTKDEYLPYDPEAGGVGGTTNFDIDVPKTFTFGLNVGL